MTGVAVVAGPSRGGRTLVRRPATDGMPLPSHYPEVP